MVSVPEHVRKSRAEARRLAEALQNGWRPTALTVPIQLGPGEYCYSVGNAQVWQFLEGDGTYLHKTRFGLSAAGLAMAAGTAIGNGARRARAEREAAPRFRPVDQGPFYITNMRFAIQGEMQWTDLWFGQIRMISCDGASITVRTSGIPPIQLHAWPIDYFYVMYHFLVNGNIIQVPVESAD